MTRPLSALAALLSAVALLLAIASPAPAAAGPAWSVDSLANTNAEPGTDFHFVLQVSNVGSLPADGTGGDPVRLTASLPAGLALESAEAPMPCTGDGPGPAPSVEGAHQLTCTLAAQVPAHSLVRIVLTAAVSGAEGEVLTSRFAVSGGGAGEATTAEVTRVSAADAGFGIDSFDVEAAEEGGGAFTAAGGHPFAFTTDLDFDTRTEPRINSLFGPSGLDVYPAEPERDIVAPLPVGFLGDPRHLAQCDTGNFSVNQCPVDSQVGVSYIRVNTINILWGPFPVFNLVPPPGSPALFGFSVFGSTVTLRARLRSESDYGLTIVASQVSEGLDVASSSVTFWGDPAAAVHDPERACPGQTLPFVVEELPGPSCPAGAPESAFLRMPTTCTAPGKGLPFSVAIDSWNDPGAYLPSGEPDLSDPAWHSASIEGHEGPGYPLPPSQWGAPKGVDGCQGVPVRANLTATPTTSDAESPSGLAVHVDVPDPGLEDPHGTSSSDIRSVHLTLPRGVAIDPSQAEGLGVCTEAQYESSRLELHPEGDHGCPSDSKIGTVSVRTPLLEETIPGSVYVAKPFQNPFGSLIALYVVLEEPQRGVLIKLPGRVATDPGTGQITASFDDLPQQPFESFDFRFSEGPRAPLVTPETCGTYETKAEITGWSDPSGHIDSDSTFTIDHGIGGGPCPPASQGFSPGFSGGTLNNAGASYSPLVMDITRRDGEQPLTRFSATLPQGLLAKLAGVSYCPDAAIAAAKGRSGSGELASPSCPAASRIGRTEASAGVGSVLTRVPGSLYLAGPYQGAPLSVVAITPAVAGPFDLGTVVVRDALRIDPATAVASVDGSASDPLPTILQGIPVRLRELKVFADRPEFSLNPTSCDPFSLAGTFAGAAGATASASQRFQAAGCQALGFKPALTLRLKGGTRRAKNPGLTAVLRPRAGDANLGRVQVALPHSEFLDQGHIKTICTRVQFAAGEGNGSACPKGSIYGKVSATSPLLGYELTGKVYLRSSSHKLPDMVLALNGPASQPIAIDAVGRIDSHKGGIRTTFEGLPDAPLTQVVLKLPAGRKSLIENSTDICARRQKAEVKMDAQSGKVHDFKAPLRVTCPKARKHRAAKAGHHRHHRS